MQNMPQKIDIYLLSIYSLLKYVRQFFPSKKCSSSAKT